jgi:hypothetical protein
MVRVEFPDYCIMQGRHQAIVMGQALSDSKVNRNGCVGCGLINCFGNSKYRKLLNEKQEEAIKNWRAYISKQTLETELDK